MADDPKGRILFLLRYMNENTDEDHPLTTAELLDILQENGHAIERKTLRNDMDALAEAGYDIVRTKGIGNSYFMGSRTFDEPEIRLLLDAINASRTISKRRSVQICRKLLSFPSRFRAREMRRSMNERGNKSENDQLLYISDIISAAIVSGKKISFQYWEETPENGRRLKNNGELYVVSPYDTVWNSDRYYMVCWSDKHEKIVTFRLDRMTVPTQLEAAAFLRPDDFDASRYSSQVFNMMDGPVRRITLAFPAELTDVMIDRFGSEPVIRALGDEYSMEIEAAVSNTFMAWIFTFGGKIRIVSPDDVTESYRAMLRAAIDKA